MDMYGATPLDPSEGQNIVRCKDCDKPIFESAVPLHAGKWVACPVPWGGEGAVFELDWVAREGYYAFGDPRDVRLSPRDSVE